MDALTSFDTLDLPIPVKKALEHSNISIPTEIQAQAIPHAMLGKDIIGLAQTGTGKTLAFCLPLVTLMDKNGDNNDCALILAPTREIAIQVTEVIKHLTLKMTGRWHPVLVIGGVGMQPQIDGLSRKPRFIIATPGRLVDHMGEGHAKLDNVRYLVLDEADRMLDMGFAPQLNQVLKGVPKERQTMLFSATFADEVADISKKYLINPVRVEVGPGHSVPIDTITQESMEMEEEDKFEALTKIIAEREGTVIVFTRTKYRTEKLARQLDKNGITSGRLHGDRSQSQRQTTLRAFKEGEFRVLVATDIAARGIDVPEVAYVINYDIPHVPEEYIHRIGRTGRAGATGTAISFLTPEVREEWRAILKLVNPELYAKTPKVANAVKAPKPGQRNRHDGGRDQAHNPRVPRQSRGPRQENRDNRGPRQERRPRIENEANFNKAEGEASTSQPSLEEQMSRIDRAAPRGNRNFRGNARGPGNRGASNNNRGPHRGGPNRNRDDRPRDDRPRRPQQNTRPQSARPADEVDDNIGNRAGAGGDGEKKKGWDLMGWFKK
ncbi:MAG: DEAD/DEAH box helicase [Bacteriovoracaceae bacterium]|nr:DEAD/DEAH box helicase [Bacteriovoracaceae bacterium]